MKTYAHTEGSGTDLLISTNCSSVAGRAIKSIQNLPSPDRLTALTNFLRSANCKPNADKAQSRKTPGCQSKGIQPSVPSPADDTAVPRTLPDSTCTNCESSSTNLLINIPLNTPRAPPHSDRRVQFAAQPEVEISFPTDSKERQKAKEKEIKAQGIVRVPKKVPKYVEPHFDDCGDDIRSLKDTTEAFHSVDHDSCDLQFHEEDFLNDLAGQDLQLYFFQARTTRLRP